MEEENNDSNESSTLRTKLTGLAMLLLVPTAGVFAGVRLRKEFDYPFDTSCLLAALEYGKFTGYANLLGKLSTYLF